MDGDSERCSCSALRQAARHVTRHYDAALAPVGLGLNQYAILVRLHRFGSLRLGDLAGRLVMDRSTLGHLLRPLEARGLLRLETDDADRRSRLVRLTAAGEDLVARAGPLWAQAEARFVRDFGADEGARLRADLKRIEIATFAEL